MNFSNHVIGAPGVLESITSSALPGSSDFGAREKEIDLK